MIKQLLISEYSNATTVLIQYNRTSKTLCVQYFNNITYLKTKPYLLTNYYKYNIPFICIM